MRINKTSTYFFLFVGISVILRLFSFFPSILEHDESTYLIIGRDILNGKHLYTDVTDTKPVGIFLIYAFMHAIFGYSILLKRLFVAVLVGVSAHLVFVISKHLFSDRKVAFWSGFLYILYISVWNYFGLSPNAEVFFNLFTILGLLLLLHKNGYSYFLGGLVFGLGFMIKYLVLLDFVAIALFFFVLEIIKTRSFQWKSFSHYLLAGLGFLLPFIVVNLYFYFGDNFDDFYFTTYIVPGAYGDYSAVWAYFKMILDFSIRFFPFTGLVLYVLFTKNKSLEDWHKPFFLAWIAGVLIAMYLPGKGFSHYSIQLMVPLSLVLGLFFHPGIQENKFVKFVLVKKVGLIFLIVFVLGFEVASFMENVIKKDKHLEVAEYIKQDFKPDDIIFTSNYEQIIYYLLKTDSPTKYIHSTILSTNLYKAFGIDNEVEIKKIMDKKPKYVLVERKFELLEALLKDDYTLDHSFHNKKILLYKRLN